MRGSLSGLGVGDNYTCVLPLETQG
jgi:hypothetical protein